MTERASDPTGPGDRAAAERAASESARVQALEAELTAARAERDELRRTLMSVEASVIWQAVGAVRRRLYSRVGEHSRAARAGRALLQRAARLAPPARPAAPAAPLRRWSSGRASSSKASAADTG